MMVVSNVCFQVRGIEFTALGPEPNFLHFIHSVANRTLLVVRRIYRPAELCHRRI